MPQLEVALGAGAQLGVFGAADVPVTGRVADAYDAPYQRLMTEVEAKVAARPWASVPLTFSAGLSGLPFGVPVQSGTAIPTPLGGLGWKVGARYTLSGFAVETGYHGQRIFGQAYQQSSDQFYGTLGYYFR